jgi:fluoroquinolone resistance protein
MDSQPQPMAADDFKARLADGARLRGVAIAEADLGGIDAREVVLRDCRFVDVSFHGARLEGLQCAASTFVRCRFDDAHLVSTSFTGCTFFDAQAEMGCTFARTNLRLAAFKDCTLDSCIFEGADLTYSAIRDTRGLGASFYKAVFDGAVTITECMLRYADLRDADLKGCDVSKNDLEWAVLDSANCQDANLRDTTLNRASLRGATFRGADLRNANLGGLDPRIVDVRGALIFEGQMRQILESLELIILPDVR